MISWTVRRKRKSWKSESRRHQPTSMITTKIEPKIGMQAKIKIQGQIEDQGQNLDKDNVQERKTIW